MCEKVGLMIVYDDNDSLRREEILGVTRFEGAAIGTKGGGVKQQASSISSSCKKQLRKVYVYKSNIMYKNWCKQCFTTWIFKH